MQGWSCFGDPGYIGVMYCYLHSNLVICSNSHPLPLSFLVSSHSPSPLPCIPPSFLVLFFFRFEIPEQAAWLLSQHPQGLLDGFQVHLEGLVKRLQSSSFPEQLRQQGGRSQLLDDASQCMLVLARVAGCRDNYQQLSMSASAMLKTVITLLRTLLDLCKETPSAANFVGLTEGARHAIAFVHCLVDPQRSWQRNFMQ